MYLPKQLIVGQRIFVRVREPSEGIYAATIDAIIDGRYRVVFEKSSILPCYVKVCQF